MLAGLRSRWTTPAACAAASPARPAARCRSAARDRQRAVAREARREIVAVDVRHRDVLDAARSRRDRECGRRSVCVTWRASSSSRLKRRSMSSAAAGSRRRFRTDHFQRDGDAELLIPRLIDGAHAAHAEQLDDVIARAERLAHRQRARVGRSGTRGDACRSPPQARRSPSLRKRSSDRLRVHQAKRKPTY